MTGRTGRVPGRREAGAARGLVTAVAALVVVVASVGAATAPAAADPVLDDVSVEQTPAVRGARGDLDAAVRGQADAAAAWVEADQQRLAVVAEVAAADATVGTAEADLVAARDAVARAQATYERLQAVTDRRLAALDRARQRLRRVAAAVYSTGPGGDDQSLGTFDQMSAGSRRDHVRDRVLEVEAAEVDRREARWRAARDESEAQKARVGEARAAEEEARRALEEATAERDRRLERLREAEGTAAARRADLDRAGFRRLDATVRHREARLEADVAGLDLPLVALHAYWQASATAPCEVPWWVVAGVGRVESGHGSAQGSQVRADGSTTRPIRGIPLDGGPGIAAIGDTDGGRLDGDGTWDRAVGPMQFIPGTWARWAGDGNGDGEADPHNLYDAAATAARYLCASRPALRTEQDQRIALLSYNFSGPYGDAVLANGHRYRDALDLPDVAPRTPLPPA